MRTVGLAPGSSRRLGLVGSVEAGVLAWLVAGLLGWGVCAAATAAPARSSSGDDGAWLERDAEKAIVTGQYPRAVALLRGLSALRPKDPSPQYRLAEVFTLAGQYEDAIAEY